LKKPVVGVTLNWYRNEDGKVPSYGRWLFGLNQSYAELLGKADVMPMGLLPVSEDFRSILQVVDMVVLTGGGDPDPELYGQTENGSVNCSRERPLWEMGLYRTARNMELPVMGICLGLQLIGMAEGVQLIQDIPTEVDDPCEHHGKPDRPSRHPVELVEGTLLHDTFGEDIEVSSFHHQALREVPAGFRLAARSPDGIIEAVESEDGRVIAVQWHPERDFTGPVLLRRMVDLIEDRI